MRAGLSYSQIELAGPSVLGSSYQLDFDVFTKAMSGSDYGFSMSLDTPEVRTVNLHGRLKEIYTFNPFQYSGAATLPFADDTPYHFRVTVDTKANLWVVTVNGREICRQPIAATQLRSIRFTVDPVYSGTPISTAPCAYLDNIVLTDSLPDPNFAPYFTKGANVEVMEDSGAHRVEGWATGMNAGRPSESAQLLDFQVTNDYPSLFSVAPAVDANGTLTFTLAADAAGSATVSVYLHDNGGTSNGGADLSSPQTFVLIVNQVNDPPTLDPLLKGAALTLQENSGKYTLPLTGITAGPANEFQTLSVTVSCNNPTLIPNPQVFYQPRTKGGSLSFTPAPNSSGSAIITVTVDDGSSSQHSVSRDLSVIVTAINHAPSFTNGGDVAVLEDAGPQVVTAWATNLSPGAEADAGQALYFLISTDASSLFSAGPAISAQGELTFTPAANANGLAQIRVALEDDGGIANGGHDRSATQTFNIVVTAVNDPPSFAKGSNVSVARDAGPQVLRDWATRIVPGPWDELGQSTHFSVSVDLPKLFTTQPVVDPAGTLTFTPDPATSGSAVVTIRLVEDAALASASPPQTFRIQTTTIAGTAGRYNALIQPTADGPVENERTGLLALNVATGGRFTGRVTLRGRPFVLSGSLDNAGLAHFDRGGATASLQPPHAPALELAFRISLDDGTFKLHGTITQSGQPFASVDGNRALFTAAPAAAPFQHVPEALLGSYAIAFEPSPGVGLQTASPEGAGIGMLTVLPSGVAILIGSLADGSGFTYANEISLDRQWPLYVSLAGGSHSLSGAITIRAQDDNREVDGPELHWFKPATHLSGYPDGWPSGLLVRALGSKLETTRLSTNSTSAVQVTLTGRTLAAPLQKNATLNATGSLAVLQPGADRLILRPVGKTGFLSGGFIPPGERVGSVIRGVVFPKQSSAYGYYLHHGQSGHLLVAPLERLDSE